MEMLKSPPIWVTPMSPPHLRLNGYREKYLRRLLSGGLPNGPTKAARPATTDEDALGRPHKKLVAANALLHASDKSQGIRTVTPQDTADVTAALTAL